MKQCPKCTFGVGDRFGQSAGAQLAAFVDAREHGIDLTPVWNKSNREHNIIGSDPSQTREAVNQAVADMGWKGEYFLDADHINLATVDRFIEPCDFFTLDVADEIGVAADAADVENFLNRHPELVGRIEMENIAKPIVMGSDDLRLAAGKFLKATMKAGEIYRRIAATKGTEFVTEVSMDETNSPQTPAELLVILAGLSDQKIPLQTIAPKFSGRFNKGVDYVGDVPRFEVEFNDDIAVLEHAVRTYGLPESLKLSVHSGSDKFSLYPVIREAIRRTGAGLHIKTAGTNWLEEVIGLAEAGGDALALAQEIYREAYKKRQVLCEPYATVIDINEANLPAPENVSQWSSEEFTNALRHDSAHSAYNPDLRQLLHVGFKVAAGKGRVYLDALQENRAIVSKNVTMNLLERHIKPLFA